MLAGWRLALSVGLAGVRAAGRRGHQGGGGVRLEGAARAGDRAGGPLLIWRADTTQAGQIGQAVTVGGAVLPGADRGRGRLALVPAAPDPPARGTGHGSRWHRSAGSILPFAGGFLLST